MERCITVAGLAAILASAAFGQSTPAKPAFTMADVRVTANPIQAGRARGPIAGNGRYEVTNASMLDLIATAYGLDPAKVQGGPNWLEWDRFDVIAKVPAGSTADEQRSMLQTLLADRFRLALRQDTRPVAAYALTAGKNHRLKQGNGSGESGCKTTLQGAGVTATPGGGASLGSGGRATTTVVSCHEVTMEAFAQFLNTSALPYTNGTPVVDETELKGAWDFEYRTLQRGLGPAAENTPMVTIFEALDKQLGLKLAATKIPLAVTAVESVNEKPTDNLPGVGESLTVKHAKTFEVASIKPHDPAVMFGNGSRGTPGGGYTAQGMPLQTLILVAYRFSYDRVVSAPALQQALQNRYDVIAKSPTGPGMPFAEAAAAPVMLSADESDAVGQRMRALLEDRFKLVVHQEDRPAAAYKLIAVKPKMKMADATERTKTGVGPGADGKDPRIANPALRRLVFYQNMTMAQFAEQIGIQGYLNAPVVDATGLAGAFDFTLSFSGTRITPGGGRGGPSDASDPDGSLSLAEAIEQQLGLKLVEEKRPIPVLVIDHVEAKPTDN